MSNEVKRFELVLYSDNYLVRDHLIHGHCVLPGVVFLDMIYRLFLRECIDKSFYLKNITFKEPIIISDDFDRKVLIEAFKYENYWKVIIKSSTLKNNLPLDNFKENAECELIIDNIIDETNIDINSIKNNSKINFNIEKYYQYETNVGIIHKTFMKSFGNIYQDGYTTLAELSLSELAKKYLERFYIHPVFLDASTLVAIAEIQSQTISKPFVPIFIGEFRAVRKSTEPCYILTPQNPDIQQSGDILSNDIKAYDKDGQFIFSISNLIVKQIRKPELLIYQDDSQKIQEYKQGELIDIVSKVLSKSKETINSNMSFYDLGLDSQQLLKIVSILEQKYQIKLYPTLLFEYGTISKATTYLSSILTESNKSASLVPLHYFEPEWVIKPITIDNNINDGITVIDDNLALYHTLQSKFTALKFYHTSLKEFEKTTTNQFIYHISEFDSATLTNKTHEIFNNLCLLIKTLHKIKEHNIIHILCLIESEIIFESLLGFINTIRIEYPKFHLTVVNMVQLNPFLFIKEFSSIEPEVKYDKTETRWVRRFREKQEFNDHSATAIKNRGVYLITGGAGQLGLLFAQYLSEKYQAKLALFGRSPLSHDQQSSIEHIQQHGSEVLYQQVDIANRDALQKALLNVKEKYHHINGIIHAAGCIQDALLINKTPSQIDFVLSPKIDGTINLDELTQSEPLDFFVLFSSLSSILGNIGQSDYAFANGFMNSYAEYRDILSKKSLRNGKSISIVWPLWKSGGMKVDEATLLRLQEQFGLDAINTQQGLSYFEKCLWADSPQQVFIAGQKDKFTKLLPLSQNELQVRPSFRQQDIAIIGLSGLYPDADDIDSFWENIKVGKDSIREIPIERWDYHLYYDPDKSKEGKSYSKWGSFIKDIRQFDPQFFNISPNEAKLIDPQERLFLEIAWSAVEDAGYTPESLTNNKVGVFVGVMYGQYQLFGAEKSTLESPNSFFSAIPNRVSYFFDFHGPSIALDTMCSSSMTAIQMACDNIRLGKCDLALVGGVNLSIHPDKYLILSHGKFLSSEGRCQSFGEGSDGYVPGEGIGAILLKPLHRAMQDGDHIYGVIKGSSINHGGKTSGFTVPSPVAQAAVIQEALNDAQVEPASINYIEAHGTGTSLGDPIEIAGLNKVFGTQITKNACAIGSVKSNIGHLESAAGIVAVTKVLLQFKYRQLVPSLHSEKLNPNIQFSNTPFYVQQKLSSWQPVPGYPLRASISSFGAGGSNAHLILEEPPAVPEFSKGKKPYYLITLSAKSDDSFNEMMRNLLKWLTAHPNDSLESISFTLNTGRRHFEKRCAIVTSNINELREALLNLIEGNTIKNGFINYSANKVENDDPILKKLLKQISSELENYKSLTDQDYKDNLLALASFYIKGYELPWRQIHFNDTNRRISLPVYPFQKKPYWISKNSQVAELYNTISTETVSSSDSFLTFGPFDRVIPGYSWSNDFISGKYSDLTVQAQRAMREMLFRRINFDESSNVLDFGCGYANDLIELAIKYSHLHLDGYSISRNQIDIAQQKINKKNLNKQITVFNRDSVNDPFPNHYDVVLGFEVVCHINNKKDLFSNIASHMKPHAKIILSDFMANTAFAIDYEKIGSHLAKRAEWVEFLSANHLQLIECIDMSHEVVNFLTDYDFDKNLRTVTQDSIKTALLAFNKLGLLLRDKLTSYVLLTAQKSEDLTIEDLQRINDKIMINPTPYKEIAHIENWFYTKEWEDRPLPQAHTIKNDPSLILANSNNDELSHRIKKYFSYNPIIIYPGEKFEKISSNEYSLNPILQKDWQTLSKEIDLSTFKHIINLWPLTLSHDLIQSFNTNNLAFLFLSQILLSSSRRDILYVWNITHNAQVLSPSDPIIQLDQSAIPAMSPVLTSENSLINTFVIDLGHAMPDDFENKLFEILSSNVETNNLALKDSGLKTMVFLKLEQSYSKIHFSNNATCLITGGLGGLGLKITEWLAKKGVKHFLLVGRHEPSSSAQLMIERLKKSGAEIKTRAIDISDFQALSTAISDVQESMPEIRYIIHAAGVIDHIPITQQTEETFNRIIHPKVLGAWNLHQISKNLKIDHFVLFSSIASLFGFSGQVHYAAANSFLDKLAEFRKQQDLPALSINWGIWSDVGMASKTKIEDILELRQMGFYEISVPQGLAAFEMALQLKQKAQVIISPMNLVLLNKRKAQIDKVGLTDYPDRYNKVIGTSDSHAEIISNIREHVCQITGHDPSDIKDNDSFADLGIDSVMAINLRNRLQAELGDAIKLPNTFILEYPSIGKLATFLSEIIKNSHLIISESTTYPLSLGQQRMYFTYKLAHQIPAYNCSLTLKFDGNLDTSKLQNVCKQVVSRHQILHTIFKEEKGEIQSKILPSNASPFEFLRLDTDLSTVESILDNQTYQLFNLDKGPLIRFVLIKISPESHLFMVISHHIVLDGISFHILLKEIMILYNRGDINKLPIIKNTYQDFTNWQRKWVVSKEVKQHLDYWIKTLSHANPLFKHKKTMTKSINITKNQYKFALPNNVITSLLDFCKSNKYVPFYTILTAFQIYLAQFFENNNFVIGVLTAGRTNTEFEDTVGFLLNIFPFLTEINHDESFNVSVSKTITTHQEGMPHQNVPIELILSSLKLSREFGFNPLFQVSFVYQNFNLSDMLIFNDVKTQYFDANGGMTQDDLVFEVRPEHNNFQIIIKYNPELFHHHDDIIKMSEEFSDLLNHLLLQPANSIIEMAKINLTKIPIVIASTFTAEPLESTLQFWINKLKMPFSIQFAPYNQIIQELLNYKSSLRTNRSGTNVILFRVEDLPVQLFSYNEIVKSLDGLIKSIREYVADRHAPLFICICPPSPLYLEKFMEDKQYERIYQHIEMNLKNIPEIHLINQSNLMSYFIRDYYDPITDASGHIPYTPFYFSALGTSICRSIYSLYSQPHKVIVFDADNTLWQGIIGEDGVDGIKITAPFLALQSFLVKQSESGMLLCLCSKNNEEDIMQFFDKYPNIPLKKKHLTTWKINWQSKSENIKQFAHDLKLGLDSFIFLDDNIMECEEVKANCPGVLTLKLPDDPVHFTIFLDNVWAFDHLAVTDTDKQRTQLYQQNVHREAFRLKSNSYQEFLDNLQLDISIDPLTLKDIPRVVQLTQRTNQFNMTTQRKTESEVMSYVSEGCLTITVKDRFGSYGLVGVIFYRFDSRQLVIENFLLSCRVLGKGVEHKIVSELGRLAKSKGCDNLLFHFSTTARNLPAKLFLEYINAENNPAGWILAVDKALKTKLIGEPALFEEEDSKAQMPSSSSFPLPTMSSDLAQEIADSLDNPTAILHCINEELAHERERITPVISGTSSLEKNIANLFAGILHLNEISVHDNFFELGATSLTMVQAQSELHNSLNINVPLIEFFHYPTVSTLAEFVTLRSTLKKHVTDESRAELELLSRKKRRALE